MWGLVSGLCGIVAYLEADIKTDVGGGWVSWLVRGCCFLEADIETDVGAGVEACVGLWLI
jgi:hypothetical protein